MKLKKLELFGFKSFYDKTSFDFSVGITAIVGPNGCGKSNIVDAIRCVLGEHAPSYLRSKALEDVIFAGSDAAGPLGMTEVSLTFSNEDGFAPPGYESYAEVQVTRRTFRDGEGGGAEDGEPPADPRPGEGHSRRGQAPAGEPGAPGPQGGKIQGAQGRTPGPRPPDRGEEIPDPHGGEVPHCG